MSADPPKTVPSSGGKVPLVSEVLERLVADLGGEASRRPAFFQAALQVCSEELRAVKVGGSAASLEDLVARARKLLGAAPAKPAAAAVPPAPPAAVPRTARAAAVEPPSLPFPDDEPTKEHVFPESEPAARQRDSFEDDLFTIDEPGETPLAAGSPAPAGPVLPVELAALPVAPPVPAPVFRAAAPTPPPPRAGTALETGLPIAAPAVRDLFGQLTDQAAPPLETPTGDELSEALADAPFEPYGHDVHEPRSRRRLLGVALGGTALVVVVVAVLWLFGGALRSTVLPAPEIAVPTAAATPRYQSVFEPEGATAGSTPAPQPVNVAAQAATPVPTAPAPAAAPVRATGPSTAAPGVAVMVSPDWAGRPPAYGIHFSSYQERERAERDAAQIAASHGRPAMVAEVGLGSRGRWYRVVLVGFADVSEARAYHARLRAQGTPGVGGVYFLVAPE